MNLGNIFILGDSYSTFEGYIPKGYDSWYFGRKVDYTDVSRVEETWWHQLINKTQSKLLQNCSWSGSAVCHTRHGQDFSYYSFVTRFDKLVNEGFFKENKPDTVFVFGGTNDSWCESPLGELKYSGFKKQDLFSFLPAVCYLLDAIKTELPKARVIFIVNTELKPEVTQGISAACENYGVEEIVLKDIDKQSRHPNIAGMAQIAEQVFSYLQNKKSVANK